MKTKINDFSFRLSGYGHYVVTYTSPKTQKVWSTKTNDMVLIDLTKNEDNPKQKDLNTLKAVCKR